MKQLLIALLALAALPHSVWAQQQRLDSAVVVDYCGAQSLPIGGAQQLTMDTSGRLCMLGLAAPGVPYASGPGDVVPGAFAWWGLRAYSAAEAAAGTQSLVNIRNGSTNEQCDVLVDFTGGLGKLANCTGSSNGQSIKNLCQTTCYIATAYDQTGNGNDLVQPVAANQPQLLPSCLGNHPCIWTGPSDALGTGTITPSAIFTLSVVAFRSGGPQGYGMLRYGGSNGNNAWLTGTAASKWNCIGGANGSILAAATDGAWHAGQCAVSASSSVANLDGIELSATVTGNTANQSFLMAQGGSQLLRMMEGGIWTTQFNQTQRNNMFANQQAYWGF